MLAENARPSRARGCGDLPAAGHATLVGSTWRTAAVRGGAVDPPSSRGCLGTADQDPCRRPRLIARTNPTERKTPRHHNGQRGALRCGAGLCRR